MTEEFSQLANISPPKSQVVTIHARNKSSDICVSETDHSDSPFNTLRQKRQPLRKRPRSTSFPEAGSSSSMSTSTSRDLSLQRKVDSLQRQLTRQNRELTRLSKENNEIRSTVANITRNPALNTTHTILAPETTDTSQNTSRSVSTAQKRRTLRKRVANRKSKMDNIFAEYKAKQTKLLDEFRARQRELQNSIRRDRKFM